MILHDIPQGAALFVIGTAPFHAEGFANGNLDMVDIIVVPDRLEDHVGKPEDQQVLDRFLTEVMVDPVDLAFLESGLDGLVELSGGIQVAAEGFFHNQPGPAALGRIASGQPRLVKLIYHRCNGIGRSGQVE